MKLNLDELSKAVVAVAGIASARDSAVAERDALVKDAVASQAAVDTLTASLIAATTSPAEAVGLAAVASALAVPAPAAVSIDPVNGAPIAPVMVNPE